MLYIKHWITRIKDIWIMMIYKNLQIFYKKITIQKIVQTILKKKIII